LDKEADLNQTGYTELALAIVKQAKVDYVKAIRHGNKAGQIECERFFRSQWFEMLSNMEIGDEVIRHIREEAGVRTKESYANIA